MKRIERKITCACCGHKEVFSVVSSHRVKPVGLDGKPLYDMQLREYQECPECHYVSWDISRGEQDRIKKVTGSQKYAAMFESGTGAKERYEAMLMLEENEDNRLMILLQYLWWAEFHDRDAVSGIQKMTASALEGYLMRKPEITYILIYIDIKRQLAEFDDVMETVQNISGEMERNKVGNEDIYRIYLYEKQLIEKGDSAFHVISEVLR